MTRRGEGSPTTMTFPYRSCLGTGFLWFLLALSRSSVANAEVTKLTINNFESLTEGKNVFIKFFAPWCGHCRAMAPDWEKLANEWEGHAVGLIAEVDCTSDDGQPICEEFDVQGFPTLVYGDPMSAETYDGPREYEDMAKFAQEHISKPICSIFHLQNCNDEETKVIEELQEKTDDDLLAMIDMAEAQVQLEETSFDEKVAEIQAKYDELVEEFNKNLDTIKEKHNYKFVEQLLTLRQVAEDVAAEEAGEGSDEL